MSSASSAASSFGVALCAWRNRAGLSFRQLGIKVHYSSGHLCKVEAGVKVPTPELALRLDVALRAGGELARLVPARRAGAASAAAPAVDVDGVGADDPADAAGDMWLVGYTELGGGVAIVERATVLAALGPATLVGLGSPADAGWADPETVRSYRDSYDRLRERGQLVGPAGLMPTLLSEGQALVAAAAGAAPELRPDLYRLASRFAELSGWMAQEAGRDELAVRLTDEAARLARRAGDDLAAFRLVRLADIAMYTKDAARTIDLSSRALAAATDPRVRGLAAQRLAHGYALANNREACLSALDQSRELLSAPVAGGVSSPVMGSSHVPDHGAMARGWCLFDLGDPGEAAQILAVEVSRLPASAHRARARYGTRLARCYADLGELNQACDTVEPILRRLPSLQSATAQVDLAAFATTLRRYHSRPRVRRLMPLLADARARQRHPRDAA